MAEAAEPAAPAARFVAGLVLAAGGSSRLGRPRLLPPSGSRTLLHHTIETARTCGFDQLVVALGRGADDVREDVNLSGVDVVEDAGDGDGRSSIAVAMDVVDPRTDVLVLLLGDRPGVTGDTVADLLAGRRNAALAVCRYDGGLGQPFAFARALFPTLRRLQGDKAVWKLVAAGGDAVAQVPVAGPVPIDVAVWAHPEAVR